MSFHIAMFLPMTFPEPGTPRPTLATWQNSQLLKASTLQTPGYSCTYYIHLLSYSPYSMKIIYLHIFSPPGWELLEARTNSFYTFASLHLLTQRLSCSLCSLTRFCWITLICGSHTNHCLSCHIRWETNKREQKHIFWKIKKRLLC